jgi:hypothetical protein
MPSSPEKCPTILRIKTSLFRIHTININPITLLILRIFMEVITHLMELNYKN